jgi:hypothetical protein
VRRIIVVLVAVAAAVGVGLPVPAARGALPWDWPVVGPIIRGFDPPDSPYGAGHRGIDIAAPLATTILAPGDGVVSFAGAVGGKLFLTIDHGGGVTSTCSWLTSLLVRKGASVARGQPVATTGWGHADLTSQHLHFSVRLDGDYVDPLSYLAPLDVSSFIRLAPLADAAAGATAAGRMTGLAYPTALHAARRVDHRGVGGPGNRPVQRDRPVAAVPGRPGPRRGRVDGPRAPVLGVVAGRRGHR